MRFVISVVATSALVTLCNSSWGQNTERQLAGALSGIVESALIENLGHLRTEVSDNWGNTAKVWTGETKVVFQGVKSHVEKIYTNKNHGLWKRSWVELENSRDNLDLKIRRFKRTGKTEITFQIYVTAKIRGKLEARAYNHGVRLASGTFNGRADGEITVDCRCGLYKEGDKLILRNRVENASIKYSNVVLDRAGVFGGYSARVLGDAFTWAVDKWLAEKKQSAIGKAKLAVRKALGKERPMKEPERTQLLKIIKVAQA